MIATLFAAGTTALLLMVERSVTQYATEVAHDNVVAEMAVLLEEDRDGGRVRLIQAIVRREKAVREHQIRYVLIAPDGHRVIGSLAPAAAESGWHSVTMPNRDASGDDGAPTLSLTAYGRRLGDHALLVVASDNSDLDELRARLESSAMAFGIAIALLALIGGLVVGTVFLRRLDRVNHAVELIMRGAMTERLPAIGMSSEFDQLTGNLNRMLERIERLMAGLRQVTTDIAHDLRTPLTRLRQRIEALRASAAAQPLAGEFDAILAETDAILAIFRALLRISELEAGSGKHRFAAFDLSEVTERVFRAYLPVAEDAEHQLVAKIDPGISILGDSELITQAITNLIENALSHTPPSSRVALALTAGARGATLGVADNGPGIPSPHHSNVLRRFYRLEASRQSPGAGLGLALVAAITDLHAAQLTLSDNHPGLRVEILFPANTSLGSATHS
ncbi:HAMP domain-containing sensor histidine kinase [Sphingomonas sp. RT2P30]|uniref:sensor histidine kinase n=1 Tax=Parasphingomonas halimpatiens TaxID=3096162 RepID=UPI002FC60A51